MKFLLTNVFDSQMIRWTIKVSFDVLEFSLDHFCCFVTLGLMSPPGLSVFSYFRIYDPFFHFIWPSD